MTGPYIVGFFLGGGNSATDFSKEGSVVRRISEEMFLSFFSPGLLNILT